MSLSRLAESIKDKALELGYEACGLTPVGELDDYGAELDERLARIPSDGLKKWDQMMFDYLSRFQRLKVDYPWAQSVLIVASSYGKYRIPPNLLGRVASGFCVDSRIDPQSPGHKTSLAFELFLLELGLKAVTERKYGLVPLRWAAKKAGLGLGRRNNFFYLSSGSYVRLEAWVLDKPLELLADSSLKPCPKDCQLCQKACPTLALTEPYLTRPGSCLTFINASSPVNWINHPFSAAAGAWIYGCEVCQNACPFNRGQWKEELEFPGLEELSLFLDLTTIVELDYSVIEQKLGPKFWYIAPDRDWQWKVNALNAMKNQWEPEYRPFLRAAMNDARAQVRDMATWVESLVA
ncbi:MAG: epoxyqueuosine reductase [Deltaproteobacteria bacterium]|jgi:epoxyqueuosine reductase|nr:epoxyqueuosine reductase [Deltaproteobacteria bacterium]